MPLGTFAASMGWLASTEKDSITGSSNRGLGDRAHEFGADSMRNGGEISGLMLGTMFKFFAYFSGASRLATAQTVKQLAKPNRPGRSVISADAARAHTIRKRAQ
jgi:hypothetical protein